MSVHPARLAACFTPPVPETVAASLLGHPRFASGIAVLIADRHGLFDDALPDADRILIAMDRAALEALAARAGIVIHARTFLREIRGPVIAERTARFGDGALASARTHSDLALDRSPPTDTEGLAQAVQADGIACLAAWVAGLPPAVRARAALIWPDDAALPLTSDTEIRSHGPAVLRRLAETAA